MYMMDASQEGDNFPLPGTGIYTFIPGNAVLLPYKREVVNLNCSSKSCAISRFLPC